MQRMQAQASVFVVGGRYEIKDPPIGQGGMGVVYRAYDTVTRRYVALKTIVGGANATALALFEKEWSVLARLSHPNIIDIIETGQFEESGQKKPFFVMPLLQGVTLDHLIKQASQRLTVERGVAIVFQACRGLQAAHDQGLIHRDIKPSNIFVLDDDSVKLIDFGVVHLAEMSTMTVMKGTLNYLAPELLDHKPPSVLSDVFALGVVCYETLTRRKPFERPTEDETVEAIRRYIPPPASDINGAVNEMLSRTVHKAMAKQPWHRFSSAREFAEALRKALRNEPIEYFDPSKIQPRIERVKRAQSEGDYQFAKEILGELEAEGHIDLQITLLRMQLDQAIKQKTIRQLLESARTRVEEEEYPLALQKVQEALEIEANNPDALTLKGQIERHRNEKQIDNWYRLVQQHIENQLFSQARLGLEEILRINPADARAHALLDQVDQQEREANKIREEKEQLYQAALKCYQNGEVSTALDKLEHLLELTRQSTRTSNPDKDAQYQSLYNQIRSERDALRNGYAEARRCLEDKNFKKALALCTEFLGRNPSDPLFQALKLEVDERERQERSAALADVDRRVEAEADLERKINILKGAVDLYPNETHFKEALKLARGRRDLLEGIMNRAKVYEEHSQFNEALGQWDILRNIYPQYPGLDAEVQRLRLKREQQLREETKSRWVRQIDQSVEAGEFQKAQLAVSQALQEFPGDLELASLEKLTIQGAKKQLEAQQCFEQGQKALAVGQKAEGIALLRKAVELNSRDRTLRGSLLAVLLDQAATRLNDNWRESQALLQEALKCDRNNPVARSLMAQVQDRERQALVDTCVLEARELQAAGDLEGALSKVRAGLAELPRESRLLQLESTLLTNLAARSPGAQEKPQQPVQTPERNRRLSPDRDVAPTPPESPSGPGPTPQTGLSEVPLKTPGTVPQPRVPHRLSLRERVTAALGRIKLPAWSLREWSIIAAVLLVVIATLVIVKIKKSSKPPVVIGTNLRANVPDAKFFVDGQPVDPPVVLSPGQEHVVEAAKLGYQSAVEKVTVVAVQPSELQLVLVPLLPRLQLLSDLKAITASVGDQPPNALQNGSLEIGQISAGSQVVKVSDASKRVLKLSFNVEPGKQVVLPPLSAVKGYSVVMATILGTHARVLATPDIKGNSSGQALQSIPDDGMEVDTQTAGPIFALSTDQTLPLEPSNQPTVIVLIAAHQDEEPQAVKAKPLAHLTLVSIPPDSEIHIDDEKPITATGTLQLPIQAGVHKIFLSKTHFEDSPVITVTLAPGRTEKVSADRLPLEPQGAFVFKINPATATVTYQADLPGQESPPRELSGNDTVWLKPGRYSIKVAAAGYVPEHSEYDVKAGAATEVKRSLKAIPVEATPTPTPLPAKGDPFEDAKQWMRSGNWWVLKSPSYGWLHPTHGIFDLTIQRTKKGFLKGIRHIEWTVDYHDDGNKIVYAIDDNAFHRVAYKGGKPVSEQIRHLSKHSGDYKLALEISSHSITVSEAGGATLDDYERPNSNGPLGKIGFKGEIALMVQQR